MRVELWGWDSVGGAWVKLLCNAAGKLIIDPSEILEEPPTDGEVGKAATSNWSHDHDADPDAHHAAFVAADHTAIGDGAPHHAAAHTLASHSTKAHAELTDVTENQHHARQHALNAGADHTGRAALSQMPDGTLSYVLTGQGAGVDPAYAAAAGGGSKVVWKEPSERALSLTGKTATITWTDLDLTAYTSADAKIAIVLLTVHINTSGMTGSAVFIRKNGTTSPYFPRQYGISGVDNDNYSYGSHLIGLDAGQVLEYYLAVSPPANLDMAIDVLGYIE